LGGVGVLACARLICVDSRRFVVSKEDDATGRSGYVRGFMGSDELASRLHLGSNVNAYQLDPQRLFERIAIVLGDCLAIGSLNRKTGALSAALPRTELWAALLAPAAAGIGPVFPGVRLATVAALISNVCTYSERTPRLEEVSFVAEDARILFQRCPWDDREVLFMVLPENGGVDTNLALFRMVLESVRRDVAIVRAPRVEEHLWN